MADASPNWENLSIYFANLSPVYLCSSLFTILALFFTWWFGQCSFSRYSPDQVALSTSSVSLTKNTKNSNQNLESSVVSGEKEKEYHEDDSEGTKADQLDEKPFREHSVMKQIKIARLSEIEKQLTAGLSEEQLVRERETQASQLAAIYKLLKEKEDRFPIRSMDEVHEQFKLYRA